MDLPNTPEERFIITFYADAGGVPVAIVDPFVSLSGNRIDTGIDISQFDLYSYSADIPALTLAAGTMYCISIVNDHS